MQRHKVCDSGGRISIVNCLRKLTVRAKVAARVKERVVVVVILAIIIIPPFMQDLREGAGPHSLHSDTHYPHPGPHYSYHSFSFFWLALTPLCIDARTSSLPLILTLSPLTFLPALP